MVEPETQQKMKGKKLTAEMILLGAEYTEEMEVKAYGGAIVEIMPLTSGDFFKASSIMAKRTGGAEISENDAEKLKAMLNASKDGSQDDDKSDKMTEMVMKVLDMGYDIENVAAAMEYACMKGILDDGIRAAIKKDRRGAAMEIGSRIMEISSGDDEAVLDFIVARTASS